MRTGTKILTGKGWEWQEVDSKRNKVFNKDGTPKIIPSHKIEATIDEPDEIMYEDERRWNEFYQKTTGNTLPIGGLFA